MFAVFTTAFSRGFVIKARVADDILDFNCFLTALATLVPFYWIIFAMESMSFSFCSVANRFLN